MEGEQKQQLQSQTKLHCQTESLQELINKKRNFSFRWQIHP